MPLSEHSTVERRAPSMCARREVQITINDKGWQFASCMDGRGVPYSRSMDGGV